MPRHLAMKGAIKSLFGIPSGNSDMDLEFY